MQPRPLSSFRRRAGVASVPLFFVALIAATLLEPTDSTANADQLRAVAAHAGAMQAAAWFEIAAGMLAPVAVLTLATAVHRRGIGLAHVGAVLGVIGATGMTFIGLHRLFVVALGERGGTSAAAVLDRLDHLAPIVLALFFALPIAFVLLAGAAVRAGLVPRRLLVGAILFLVVDLTPLPGAELIQLLVGLVTFGWIARAVATPGAAAWSPRQSSSSESASTAAA